MSNKVVKYNVWVHIEGVNRDGDTVEDEYHEPQKVGEFKKLIDAEMFRDMLSEAGS